MKASAAGTSAAEIEGCPQHETNGSPLQSTHQYPSPLRYLEALNDTTGVLGTGIKGLLLQVTAVTAHLIHV
jgi:hypothetical protein